MPEEKGYKPYKISVAGNVITVGFGSRTSNDNNCRDIRMQLDTYIAAGVLVGGELIKITGAGSVHTSSTITGVLVASTVTDTVNGAVNARHICHALAYYDRHQKGPAKFVITWSRGLPYTSYTEGQLIE